MACWFRIPSVTVADHRTLICVSNSATINNWIQTYVSSAGNLTARSRGAIGNYIATHTTKSLANTWYHALAVYANSSSRIIYLDGLDPATNSTDCGAMSGQNRTAVGRRISTGTAGYMGGDIGEVAIWSAGLNAAEALMLATGISPLAVRPQSLVAYWPLFGTQSPEIDRVGGYDMTLTNGPTQADHPPALHLPSSRLSYQEPADGNTLLVFDPRTGRPAEV
jgi:hypothetical protein